MNDLKCNKTNLSWGSCSCLLKHHSSASFITIIYQHHSSAIFISIIYQHHSSASFTSIIHHANTAWVPARLRATTRRPWVRKRQESTLTLLLPLLHLKLRKRHAIQIKICRHSKVVVKSTHERRHNFLKDTGAPNTGRCGGKSAVTLLLASGTYNVEFQSGGLRLLKNYIKVNTCIWQSIPGGSHQ